MSASNGTSPPDRAVLRERLSALSASQRAQLAGRIARADARAGSPDRITQAEPLRVEAAPGADAAGRTVSVYPAGQGQLQMWFLQYYAPESPVYNIPQAFQLHGPLDVAALAAAFCSLIDRHAALRTTFAMEDGQLRQRVASSSLFQLQQIDVASAADPRVAAEQRVNALACCPFDLVSEPQIRAALVRLSAQEHVLIVVTHHIISDGWSQSNLFRDLAAFYTASKTGSEAALPRLPLQFADFSVWQEKRLRDSALAEQVAYWRTQLGGNTEPLELPTDRARSGTSSFRGNGFSAAIPAKVWEAVRARAQAEGATVFMVVLAAFKLLLHRYTAQDDIRVGVPIANRQQVETEGLVGFFVNTLVMRTAVSSDLTFRELLARVKATAVGAYANADLSFERLVEMFTDQPAADRAQLLQTLFAFQDFPDTTMSIPGIEAVPRPVGTRTAKVELGLFVEPDAGGWITRLQYNTDLFDADRIERMMGHWLLILESVADDPTQRIAHVPLLTAAERHRVLVEWNETAREYPRDKTVHELFAEQARAKPEAIALVTDGESVTYDELNSRAEQVADHLRALGVDHGSFVGLQIERSIELVIALLGILKAGGGYWAVEANLPEERLRVMMADARPKVLLTRRNVVGEAQALTEKASPGTHVAAIEDLLATTPHVPSPARSAAAGPGVAYLSYTSGSTGVPKGVLVPHRAIVRLVRNVDYVSLTPNETLLQMAPLSFDASTFELWGALLNGGRLVVMPRGIPSLTEIGKTIRRHGVTTVWLTAGLFHAMVDQRLDDLAPLRQLLAGGDVLSPAHVRKAREALPRCRLINGYGPTENTTFTACYTIAPDETLEATVPIGRPIANTRVYVLDSALEPVPIGVPGELYAGGDGVALGYLNQPELTAERFMPDPFSSDPHARLYRTGDRVRWHRDGNLEFIGRRDTEVKIRGYRVDLAEIESALRGCADISDAAVVRRDDRAGGHALVAYVVPANAAEPSNETLRAHLASLLPDYMVPATFVRLDALPIAATGKVDRRALPMPPQAARPPRGNAAAPPASLLESELTRLWQRLFQRTDISRDDNFFALGGHSLLAARLMAEIDELVGANLPIAALFQSPTIASLAARLTEEQWAPKWSSLVPLQPHGSKPPLFFAHGARGDVYVYFGMAKLLAPDQPSYALQAVGFDGKTTRHTTVEEMAAHYIEEMRSLQPTGPYHLAGFSMAGLIAYEIAQQLHKRGEQVALLALIDTAPSSVSWPLYAAGLAPFFQSRARYHWRRWRKLPMRYRLAYLRRCWGGYRWWWARTKPQPRAVTAAPEPGVQVPTVPGFHDYYWAVAAAYRVRRYPGSLDFIFGDSINRTYASFWNYAARKGAILQRLPGDHLDLVSPEGLPALAKALTNALERSQSEARPTI